MNTNNPFAGLTPEQLQQLVGLGSLNQQDELLEQQLAMAQQLRTRPQAQGYGALGGIGAGIQNALTGLQSGLERKDALAQLQQNRALEDAGRKQYALGLARASNPGYGMGEPLATAPNRLGSSLAGMVAQPDPMALAQARAALLRNRPPPMLARDFDADDEGLTDFGA